MQHDNLFNTLGLNINTLHSGDLTVHSPIDGTEIAGIAQNTPESIDQHVTKAQTAFLEWRNIPAPKRGELIRLLSDELRTHKEELARLITIENGKILAEARGEVQEMIDICEFAVGISRQLYGLTIASERPDHQMLETWHPLGIVGLISPFNFPVSIWAWNFAVSTVCGNSMLWKPSEKTPLTALACVKIFEHAAKKLDYIPANLLQLIIGKREVVEKLIENPAIPLISATGSTPMGKAVGQKVAARLGRTLLELGGNNGMIVTPSADLNLALPAVVFSAAGTAGQRCTTLRRMFVHTSIYDQLINLIKHQYEKIKIGNPLEKDVLVGPLIDQFAFKNMQKALEQAKQDGGKIFGGQRVLQDKFPEAFYVQPALVEMPTQTTIVKQETFAPILYVMRYDHFDDAIAVHNDVPQGLSSCIFTNDIREAELFLSARGSDCGIANVNIGPSGAEIGGAFGGEKATGGGRESGSDAWKNYMRRATNTINFSSQLPLAQGVKFDIS